MSFCDAIGLSVLEAARDSVVRAGAEFALAGVRPTLLRILSITRLDAAFGLRLCQGLAASPDSCGGVKSAWQVWVSPGSGMG
ncbi:STAS domain-containing protein [Streptomyces sp. 1222.5]|uniref:STAS domain-containing protein n=1 Tax=Streptomyces sp. 1222.5 TaxID=1881026 RepID=UPI003EBC4CC1